MLFSDVHVHSYSDIEDSLILPKVNIGRYVKIRRAIIDSGCHIQNGMSIGINKQQDMARGFRLSDEGIVLVTEEMLTNIPKSFPKEL
jgi:glucose-1-phosphate adenylyltransferase